MNLQLELAHHPPKTMDPLSLATTSNALAKFVCNYLPFIAIMPLIEATRSRGVKSLSSKTLDKLYR
jgi:hypothetical protein